MFETSGRNEQSPSMIPVVSIIPTVLSTNCSLANLPRIRNVGGMAHASPIGCQVILRCGQVPTARERGRHCN